MDELIFILTIAEHGARYYPVVVRCSPKVPAIAVALVFTYGQAFLSGR